MKFGILTCKQNSRNCTGKLDLLAANDGAHGFSKVGPVEVIELIDCGGCPGFKVKDRINAMLDAGAEGIAIASCISGSDSHPYPCCNYKKIQSEIHEEYGDTLTIVDSTF